MTDYTNDPEYYTDRPSTKGVPSEVLQEALGTAQHIYNTCGGHNRAARMRQAVTHLSAELAQRALAARSPEDLLTKAYSLTHQMHDLDPEQGLDLRAMRDMITEELVRRSRRCYLCGDVVPDGAQTAVCDQHH